MRKVFLIALVFGFLGLCPGVVSAAESIYQVDVGSFDIWKNSAGEWIPSEPPRYMEASQPGDTVRILPYQIKGPSGAIGVKSVQIAAEIEAWRLGNRAEEYARFYEVFGQISDITFTYLPDTKSVQVQYYCTLVAKSDDLWTGESNTLGEPIRKEWQSETVEGYRYYMPLLVEWETGGIDLAIESDETKVIQALAGEPVNVKVMLKSFRQDTGFDPVEAELKWTGPEGEGSRTFIMDAFGVEADYVTFTGYAGNTYYVTGEIMPTVETDIDLSNNKTTTKIVIVIMTPQIDPDVSKENPSPETRVNLIG